MKEAVRHLLHARPFRPFVIRMTNGQEYRIEDPAFVMASPSVKPFILLEESEERIHHLSTLLIASVEPVPSAKPAT